MNDIYLYEGTNVLINKLNIRDYKALEEAEGTLVSLNIARLLTQQYAIKDLLDVKQIHKALFFDLYEWAGENRKMNMYKEEPVLDGLSVTYSDYRSIEKDLQKLNAEYKKIKWKELTKKQTVETISNIIARLWRIHCFREGNTRTVTTLLYLLMKQIGLTVNTDFLSKHAKFFRNALVMCSIDEYSEPEHLINIMMDSVSMKDIGTGQYKTIHQYEVDKYEYKDHKYKD